jgi:hypothetical protein
MNLFTWNSPYYHSLKYLLFLLKHSVYEWWPTQCTVYLQFIDISYLCRFWAYHQEVECEYVANGICYTSELTVSRPGSSIPTRSIDIQLKNITSTMCHIYTFDLLMMGCWYAWNRQRCDNSINWRYTAHHFGHYSYNSWCMANLTS